jgi:G6PDH family F420-dependent oxidoreductase
MPHKQAITIGYKLSSEEFSAPELVRQARAAEEHGFAFAFASDHYHPWTDRQGQSPFVWSVIGAIAQATERLAVGTAVTCPSFRLHPAIVAQAAATAATMLRGGFFLGLGTGENLNEHIVASGWPEIEVRQERLAEAIEVIRLLWRGGEQSYRGRHFVVENARLYSLPEKLPPILVAASGERSARLAARLGDGLIATEPDGDLIRKFQAEAGSRRPCYGELTVSFDQSADKARDRVYDIWPLAGLPGQLLPELALPSLFEKAGKLVVKDKLAEVVPCGADPETHLKAIRRYAEAGFDHVFIHQIGPKQEEFMDFYAREILPRIEREFRREAEQAIPA